MGETEVRTADSSGTVQNASQEDPTPKSKASAPKAKSGKASERSAKLNARGVPVTAWDNPDADPNLRKHVGESPDGKGNEIK